MQVFDSFNFSHSWVRLRHEEVRKLLQGLTGRDMGQLRSLHLRGRYEPTVRALLLTGLVVETRLRFTEQRESNAR